MKALLVLITIFATNLYAHGGRTDSDGGHNNRKTGEYHCHKQSCFTIQKAQDLQDQQELAQEIAQSNCSWGLTKWLRQQGNLKIKEFTADKFTPGSLIKNQQNKLIGFSFRGSNAVFVDTNKTAKYTCVLATNNANKNPKPIYQLQN